MFKKKKVKMENLRTGDAFSFQLGDDNYGFGVVVSKIMEGHVSEIFNYFSNTPVPDLSLLRETFSPPVVLDTYSLLQKGNEGNWSYIGRKDDYEISDDVKNSKFSWGMRGDQSIKDIYNKSQPVSDDEAAKWPRCQPWGDLNIKEYLRKQGVALG